MSPQMATLSIPDGVEFPDLQLARQDDGSIMFDWSPIKRICAASNIPVDLFREAPEDNVAGLIISWYITHLKRGGSPDPVAEALLSGSLAANAAQPI